MKHKDLKRIISETISQLNEKRKIDWKKIYRDIKWLIEELFSLGILPEEKHSGKITFNDEAKRRASSVLSAIQANPEAFQQFSLLNDIIDLLKLIMRGGPLPTLGERVDDSIKQMFRLLPQFLDFVGSQASGDGGGSRPGDIKIPPQTGPTIPTIPEGIKNKNNNINENKKMAKLDKNRFRELAGLKPLYESQQLNEKRKINWLQIILDVISVIKFLNGIIVEQGRGVPKNIQSAAQNILTAIRGNMEEFQQWGGDLNGIIQSSEMLASGQVPPADMLRETVNVELNEAILNEFLKGLWKSFLEWLRDRYTYEVDDEGGMVTPGGGGGRPGDIKIPPQTGPTIPTMEEGHMEMDYDDLDYSE